MLYPGGYKRSWGGEDPEGGGQIKAVRVPSMVTRLFLTASFVSHFLKINNNC